jgi:two-component system, NtrC family, response regulator
VVDPGLIVEARQADLFRVQPPWESVVANILVIDDDRMMCGFLATMGRRMKHEVVCAFSLDEGLRAASSKAFDVVFLDVRLPDGNGLDGLPQIRESSAAPEVIIFTGAGDPDGAELAIRNGAWDYIQKPSTMDEIKLPLVRALQFREKKRIGQSTGGKGHGGVVALKRQNIVGNSPRMRASLDLLAQAANSKANVLITGETGTGKELFAWAIHDNSPRTGKPFVVVDCASLTESLVENVLFGHEKGAFTGADKPQDGMIKQADGGTLMLDEVGELPLPIQKAFLRVLQERRFRPLGAKAEVHSNFRLIAATNRNLEQMVHEGQFREDLFFRIRSLVIELPPLRKRLEDMRELAMYHMARLCARYETGTRGLSPEFLQVLARYDWPGNVRELVHAMESALISAGSESLLFPDHLPLHIRIQVARAAVTKTAPAQGEAAHLLDSSEALPSLNQVREAAIAEIEQQYLQHLVATTGMEVQEACRIAGLSRSQLYSLLKKHGISRIEKTEDATVAGSK